MKLPNSWRKSEIKRLSLSDGIGYCRCVSFRAAGFDLDGNGVDQILYPCTGRRRDWKDPVTTLSKEGKGIGESFPDVGEIEFGQNDKLRLRGQFKAMAGEFAIDHVEIFQRIARLQIGKIDEVQ